MIELAHQLAEPVELKRHRTSYPDGPWGAPAFEAVRPVIRRQLNLEQQGLCVCCKTRLGENEGHVEHIKSKHVNPPLTFVYENLAHSCDGPGHCGHHKGREKLPVEPRPGCNRFFAVMVLDGRIVPAEGLAEEEGKRAADTLRILALNAPSLSWQRKGFADAILPLSPAEKTAFMATNPFRWALRGT